MKLDRRFILLAAGVGAIGLRFGLAGSSVAAKSTETFPISHTDEEWQKRLSAK